MSKGEKMLNLMDEVSPSELCKSVSSSSLAYLKDGGEKIVSMEKPGEKKKEEEGKKEEKPCEEKKE